MSKAAAPKRQESDFIQSASVTAMMRALLAEEDDLTKNPDYLAKYFVSEPWRQYLAQPAQSKSALQKRVPGGIYYHLVRTKKMDNAFVSWAKKYNECQIVILGAGLDSRGLRFAQDYPNAKIYEYDLKGMFDYKIDIINSNESLAKLNGNIDYVPINFHEETLIDSMTTNQIAQSKNTLVIWEGVSYFLEEQVVKSTLLDLHKFFKSKLRVIFDYAYRDYVDGDLSYYGAQALAHELEQIGEPHIFGVNPDEVQDFLDELGYVVNNNSTWVSLEREFFLKNDQIQHKLPAFHGIVDCDKNRYRGKVI
ncbi:hypothetical protein PN36_19020 [Candidatus Thiomargarita nelsonii]|uniref:S-adenosyl-L-methionine-dependent methyltransferase n=1 Tax=Candidatus Thiomargarita nelsonii TaxID=1003181 RepID=A0A0A6PEU8_9GAMM|nr:hypothetical protein PN36_19020 [Candidatus Thiomargarita nelsonii]